MNINEKSMYIDFDDLDRIKAHREQEEESANIVSLTDEDIFKKIQKGNCLLNLKGGMKELKKLQKKLNLKK